MPGEWSSMQTSESWRVKKVGWQESCPSWVLSGTRRRGPAHQAAWEAFMVLLVIRHFVPLKFVGELCWSATLWFCAKSKKINEIAKEVAMHLAPLGHELEGVHVWSETNTLADALSRVQESGVAPQGLGNAKLLAERGVEAWSFLKHLKDTM